MNTHTIRLLGPWQVEWLEPADAAGVYATPQNIDIPQDWSSLFGDRAGTARFRRWFNCPTGLGGEYIVSVVFNGVGGRGEVRINEAKLGMIGVGFDSIEFDISSHLRRRNELVVELTFDPKCSVPPGGLYDIVALRIDSE